MSSLLLILAIAVSLLHAAIRAINLRHLRRHGREVPVGFEAALDTNTLGKMVAYGTDRGKLTLYGNLAVQALILVAVFGGALERYDRWIADLGHAPVLSGVLYCLIATWMGSLISLPFDAYGHFVIEQRHGFNRSTTKLYWLDLVKSLALTSVFVSILASIALTLVQWSPQAWWAWVWSLLLAFELLITVIAQKVIEPLFMKVTPLQDGALREAISALADRVSVRVNRVYQVDASRRSGHTNAYFTGIGPVKRVVLFDTLLEKLDRAEILAVLAHELGHWKLRHVLRSFVLFQGLSLAACYGAYRLVNYESLPAMIGADDGSFQLRATLAVFVGWLIVSGLTPFFNALSRRHEWQADAFASTLVDPRQLASGLIKLARDNLANLHPHPMYAAFYGTHPTMVARVSKLMGRSPGHSGSEVIASS